MVPNDFYTSLPEKGVIQLSGAEKTSYLQGQITADVNMLKSNNALLACHCDFKGKTWSVSYLLSWHDELLLLIHHSVLSQSLSELKKYGVFAKVEITDASDRWLISGGTGKAVEAEIIRVFEHLPEHHQDTVHNDYGVVVALIGKTKRYIIMQPQDAARLISLEQTANGENYWEIEDIKAGIADVRSATSKEFVPQMMNLQQLDAISFTKGCYMGQEMVARTKYLGKNKRAAFRLLAETQQTVEIGASLEYQVDENWRPGGKVLRIGSANGQTWLLAVLSSDTEIGSVMRLKESPDVVFTVLPHPYEIA